MGAVAFNLFCGSRIAIGIATRSGLSNITGVRCICSGRTGALGRMGRVAS